MIAVSEFTRQRIIALLGVAPDRATTILDPADTGFRPLSRRSHSWQTREVLFGVMRNARD